MISLHKNSYVKIPFGKFIPCCKSGNLSHVVSQEIYHAQWETDIFYYRVTHSFVHVNSFPIFFPNRDISHHIFTIPL